MLALQRNLVPILVGVAAVLVSIASVALIVDSVSDDDDRAFAADSFRVLEPDELRFGVPFGGPLLGVTIEPREGVLAVDQVQEDSPAERAGVEAGDEIVRAAGQDVDSVAELRDVIGGLDPGEQYDLVVRRDGAEHTLQVERPRDVAGVFPFPPRARDGEPFDVFLDSLADEVEQRLRERGVVPPTASPQSGT